MSHVALRDKVGVAGGGTGRSAEVRCTRVQVLT